MHKVARIQMPDLQIIATRVNFSVPVFNAAIEFCKELGIRHQEELSFKRYIPPEILSKGLDSKEYQINTFMISPGLDPYNPTEQRTMSAQQNFATLPRNAPVVGQMARSQVLPVSSSYGSSLNRAGSVPPNGPAFQNQTEFGRLTGYQTSPYGTLNPNYNTLNNPGLPHIDINWEATLGPDVQDQNLTYSPKKPPSDLVSSILRPKNLTEKAVLNAGWLDSSRSLLEQCIFENDLILLRFKYLTFFELNPKVDSVRINQIYEQAKWGILTEEFNCNESEAFMLAGLKLQIELKTENKRNGVDEPEIDDVDLMLTELENLLEGNFMAKRAIEFINTEPELADYLNFCLPRQAGILNWKRAFFVLHGLSIHWYNSSQESKGPPVGRIYLRSADVSYDISLPENIYTIKLVVPSSDGTNEVLLKVDSEQRYSKWLAACRMASRGKTMNDANYIHEVDDIQAGLVAQRRAHALNNRLRGGPNYQQNNHGQNGAAPDSRDINPDDYLPYRFIEIIYSRSYGGSLSSDSVQQKILDSQSSVAHLNLSEAKMQYIKLWQTLREYSWHYFVVRYRNCRQPELFVITTDRMFRMGLNGEGPATVWMFSNMKKWHVNWEIRHIFIQMEEEDVEFTCLSADCKIPHEFIGGYIFMSTRSKDKNQVLNTEMFHKLTGGWSAKE
uniref:PH domain-containing protein n=1 Tax=Romanomermis culicivorax TaxID=13658 RepID=A0A915JK24_ROMCU